VARLCEPIKSRFKKERVMSNHQGALRGTPIYEIGKSVLKVNAAGKANKNSPSIVKGLKPKQPPMTEGYHILSPEQLASLLVPKQELTDKGTISGFQREIARPHIRKISADLLNGDPTPVLELSLYRNALWAVDGQHRALGAIDAGVPIPVVIRKLDAGQMRKLFASQYKARKINASTLILSADDAFSEYVQDAVTASSPQDNPWYGMVAAKTSSTSRLTPSQVHEFVLKYVSSTVGQHSQQLVRTHKFEREFANEGAELIKAFGTKRSNPLAFRPAAVRALAYAAIFIIRRRGSKASDIKRWKTHMATFPWHEYAAVTKSKDLAVHLIRHWNKRLLAENKVPLPGEIT